MGIKKVKVNGKTLYEVFVKTRDQNGKQRALRRKNITSEREARRIELDLRIQLGQRPAEYTWEAWAEHFLNHCRPQFRNSTYVNYSGKLDRVVTPEWRYRKLHEITVHDVHELIFQRLNGMSSSTRHSYLRTIKRVFSLAVEEGVLLRNPASNIKVKKPEAVQGVLNAEEIKTLLREAKSVDHRFFNHWSLALLTGMRSGELAALRWTDVDFDSGFIHVTKSWSRFNGEGATKSGKNRIVPMSNECRKFLSTLKIKTGDNEFVLPKLPEWASGMAARVLRDFCAGIGITSISFHDLRATFITQLLNNGVPLAKVMTIVGHSSLKTTQGYLRLCGKDVIGATESLKIEIPSDSGFAKVLSFQS